MVMTAPRAARLLCLAAIFSVGAQAAFSNCDVLHQGAINVADVQAMINEALGIKAAANDLNGDGTVNVVDVLIAINGVLGNGCAADPGLVSILPNSGQQGAADLAVTITGRLTSFTNNSAVSLGAGVTVSNVVAGSATTLTASLAIAGNAATGPTTLTVDGLTLANAFTPPLSVSYTYDSQVRVATASYLLASGATTTVTYTYDAGGNRTSVVAH